MNLKNNFLTIFYILLFTLYQISLVVKGGTTWDDEQLVNTSSRIINKFILFIDDPSNPFISEFVSNYEFYGYFVLIPIFLLSKNQFLSDLFVRCLEQEYGCDCFGCKCALEHEECTNELAKKKCNGKSCDEWTRFLGFVLLSTNNFCLNVELQRHLYMTI